MNTPPAELSPFFTLRQTVINASSAGVLKLLPATPNRIAFNISLIGGTPIFIWPDNSVTITKGIPIGVKIDNLTLRYKDLGPWVAGEWYVATGGLSVPVTVLETIFGQNLKPDLPEV